MGKKILVIEDDPIATRLIEYILKKRGYQVLTAPDGSAGLQMARDENPDLIILNVMLPGIDGLEVCHRLRVEPGMAQTPVLMLSGKAQPADIANGLSIGADDYLTKPAAPSEIVRRVESLLARKAGANSKMVVFVGSKERVGTTTIVVNVAIALAQMGKQVVAVDLCPYNGSISEYLNIKPQDAINRLLKIPAGAPGRRALEPALVVHETGIGVLRFRQPSGETGAPDNIDLALDRLREATDYFLVDLPFQPTEVTRAVLPKCSLAVIVSDYTTEALTGVKSTITVLRFLGIMPKRIGAVITDPVGTFSQKELPHIKSYIEPNLAVNMLGIIPYDTNATPAPSSGGRPIILSNPGSPMAGSLKELAQRIIATGVTESDISSVVKRA